MRDTNPVAMQFRHQDGRKLREQFCCALLAIARVRAPLDQ